MDHIGCFKISDDCWECSVTCDFDAFPRGLAKSGYIKFNEGHYKTKEECLTRCTHFATDRIIQGFPFSFNVSEV